jgi:hypothetical protein
MTDDELRTLVRAAIQRHLATAHQEFDSARVTAGDPGRDSGLSVSMAFGQYRLERAAGDTLCLIEPAVPCNHCGFCKCHGH